MNKNLTRYNDPEVVAHYEQQEQLFETEKYLFEKYISKEASVLDLGVGGGRTTPWLSQRAGCYAGVDYSEGMVEACRQKFPHLKFFIADATDMPMIKDKSYDIVIFSFNCIDYIANDKERASCLCEVVRILRPGGIFIFSSHNAKNLAIWPLLKSASGHQVPWRILRAIFKSFSVSARKLLSGVFLPGQGYIHDPVHGGLQTYCSTPETMKSQCEKVGLKMVEVLGDHFPEKRSKYFVSWYYFACKKEE